MPSSYHRYPADQFHPHPNLQHEARDMPSPETKTLRFKLRKGDSIVAPQAVAMSMKWASPRPGGKSKGDCVIAIVTVPIDADVEIVRTGIDIPVAPLASCVE